MQQVAQAAWQLHLHLAPGAHPFLRGQQLVIDIVRVVCVACGLAVAVLLVVIAGGWRRRELPPHTGLGIVGLAALSISATFTELGQLGSTMTWRLPVNVIGLAYAVRACWAILRCGYPQRRSYRPTPDTARFDEAVASLDERSSSGPRQP